VADDEALLRRAITIAQAARDHGNHPFGCLLAAADGGVLMEAENTVVTEADATGHAETNLVRLASRRYSRDALSGMALYASTEPCAMCSGAIYFSGIGQVVYALAGDALAGLTASDPDNPGLDLPCREVFSRGGRTVEVRGPFALPEAVAVHDGFSTRGG
jgi:tRNA(Arg) A34 adenosine deaminase TadA